MLPLPTLEKAQPAGLCIRLLNDGPGNVMTLLFQRALEPEKDLYICAWDVRSLGPGAIYDLVLPSTLHIQAQMSTPHGVVRTAAYEAPTDTSWDIIEDPEQTLDITRGSGEPGQGILSVRNTVLTGKRTTLLLKDGTGLVARVLSPGQSTRFSVPPKLFVAASSDFTEGTFYPAARLPEGTEIDYAGHENVLITARREESGRVIFSVQFVGHLPDFHSQPNPPL
jgi:hypothetical protein